MPGVKIIDPNSFSYSPALTNQVARVSMPISVPVAAMPVAQGAKAAVEKGMTIFDAAKTGLNTVKAENVYKSTERAAKTVQKTAGKLTFSQALKRCRFSGKAKIFGLIAAVGLVSASAMGFGD